MPTVLPPFAIDENSAAGIFLALSNQIRAEIVRLLVAHPEGLTGIEIAEAFEAPKYAFTAQIKFLEQVGLIVSKPQGKFTVRALRPDIGRDIIDYIRNGFQPPEPPPNEFVIQVVW